ncbi:MAG: hypothetical protein AVDCRST_MAG79-43, partial [uncultured Thermoleophilia bacterium]
MAPRPFLSAVRPAAGRTSDARWFLVTEGGLVVRDAGDGGDRAAVPGADDPTLGALAPEDALYLGRLGDEDCWAAWLDGPAPDGARVAG